MLTVNTLDGRRIEYNPVRLFGVEVFREEQRVFARGDRIQFRAPDRALALPMANSLQSKPSTHAAPFCA